MPNTPFSGKHTYDFEYELHQQIREEISRTQFSDISVDADAISATVTTFIDRYRLSPPTLVIPIDGIQPTKTVPRTVRRSEDFSLLGQPYIEQVTDIVFELSLSGDLMLLRLSPPTAPFGAGLRGNLRLSASSLEYTFTADPTITRVQLEHLLKNELEAIQRHIDSLNGWAENYNRTLVDIVRPAVIQRFRILGQQNDLTSGLNITLR